MYKVKEQRLREMLQNDDEALGALTYTDDGTGVTERTETTITVGDDGTTTTTTRRASNIQITMNIDGEKPTTESISTENVRLGGITLRGMDSISTGDSAADAIINERIRRASQDRTTRYQTIMDQYDQQDSDPVVSITKSTFSIQTGGLAGQGYHAMKNKEVRDSVSPTRIVRERRSSTEDDFSANEARLTSDDEAIIKTEKENIIKVLNNAKTTRKASRDERNSTSKSTRLSRQSEIPVRNEQTKKVNARKTSKELDFSSSKRNTNEKSSPTSPKRSPADTTIKTTVNRKTTTATTPSRLTQKRTETKTTTKSSTPTRKSKLTEIAAKMDSSIKSEMKKMGNYINTGLDEDDEIINEEEEEVVDDTGNVVKMIRQTRKKKDGTEFVARNIAHSTKVVSNESDIDEILIGNPDHEIIERNVTEELDEDGSKIKIITETRKREDGIEYTTKNVLKTSKIFDFDHPEDIAHDEEDELISSNQTEETDETGTTIQTVIETRRKSNGVEYTTKKVYKTCKVSTQITPSEDDEVIDTKEEEEKQDDGSIVRTLIETRRTKDGQEYTHRQVFKTRRMTLTGVELQQGIPMMQNDDEIIDKKEKEEIDSNGMNVKVVTETRKRKDGSTYTFEYVLRSFKGTKEDVQKMPYGGPGGSNIPVSVEDEIISEEVKEDIQEDGSTVKTIIERRRAKDGTQYLRHRIMRIPKMPEPVLQIASLEDEILKEEKNDEVLDDGIQCRRITERRRSSVSGLQYTLRRTSKVYQQPSHRPTSAEDEIMDENVTEEETDDGSVIKTIIKRFQRPDGSIYNTHHVLRTFTSPGPVKFIGIEDDELIDQSISERETEDGYIVKTINETRCRADGVQYTVERTETSSKHRSELHITFTDDAKDKIHVGNPDDVVLSREEQEEEGEDGVIIKTLTEVRKAVDGSEYTTKTVVRSTPVLVPDHETSFVVIKPDDGVEEDGLAPSMDDELIYTRKKEETDENGQMITVIIETRQSKATGEKYNITKRVHTKDVVLTPEGEKEIPKELYKTTKVAVLKGVSAPTTEPDDVDDTPYGSVSALKNRFASPQQDKETEKDNPSKPDKTNTHNRKKFFEEAAKNAQPTTPSSPKPAPKFTKTKEISIDNETDSASIEVKLHLNQEEASVADISTQNVTYQEEKTVLQTAVAEEKAEMETSIAEKEINLTEEIEEQINEKVLDVEDVNETEITEKADEIMRESVDTVKESEVTMEVEEQELVPSLDDEIIYTRKSEETDTHGQIIIILIETRVKKLTGEKYNLTREFLKEEYEAEFGSLKEQEPEPKKVTPSKKQVPTTQKIKDKPRKSPESENKTKRDISPRKKPDQEDRVKRTPVSSRKAPTKDVSTPTRTTSAQRGREPLASKDPVKRITRPSPHSSPARGSPLRGRSPLRSGTSTPRDGTPTGRQCCQRHREASAAAAAEEQVSPTKEQVSPTKEQVSPTRTPKAPSRVTTPVRKVKSPDEKPKMNGDVRSRLKTEDKVSNVRKKFEKPAETPRTSRVTQSPRKPRVSKSPDKKETPKPLPNKQNERKAPVKPADKSSTKTRPSDFLEQGGKTLMSSLDAKPVVTMPETPLTDNVKSVPVESPVEEGPVIEDVSMEPDHPYLKVQRPSLVREPSELPEIIGEMPDSTFEESPENSDVFIDNNEEQINKEPVIEDITKKEIKEESAKKSKVLEKRLSDKGINKDIDKKKKENDNKQISDKKKPFDRRSSDTEKKRPFDRKPSDEKLKKQKDEPKRTINKKPFDRKPSDEKIVKKNEEKTLKKRSSEIETIECKNNTYEHQENLKNEKMSLESQTAQYQSAVSETAVSEKESKEITDDVTTVSEEIVTESSSSEIHKKAEEMSTQLIEDVEKSIASQIISEDTVINTELTYSQLDEIEASLASDVESNITCSKKENVSSEIKSSLKDETKSKSKVEQKSITTKDVNSKKSLFDQRSSTTEKKDTPRRKPSYEMKGSVSSRKSMFEQSKQGPVPSPIRKPVVKSSPLRGNDKSEQKMERKSVLKQEKKQESVTERKPVEEPIIIPKTGYVLGEKDLVENNKSFVDDIKEDSVEVKKVEETTDKVEMVTSSAEENSIVISESESTSISTEVSESRKISKSEESSVFTESKTRVTEEKLDLDTHVKRERSKSPLSREGSQVRDNEEESPEPFSKEGSPTRFATGKPVDQGFNIKKVRRVERAASSKKLYEDLEVSKENLPSYLANIETIFEVSTLEQMLETAVSYDERRTIRTQLRLAKRQEGNTKTTSTTPAYKRFTNSSTPSATTPTSSPSITRKAADKQETKTKESTKKSLSSSEKSVSSQNLEDDSYEPTDSSGLPLFGLRALRKTGDKDSTTTSLTTSESLETTSSRLEEEVSQISESKYSTSQESKYRSETNESEKHEDITTTLDEEELKNSSQKTDYSTIDNKNDRLSDISERKHVSHDSEIIENNTNISFTETKKLESDRSSTVISRAKETVSESSTSDVYNEPLRHQKGNNRRTPRKEEQSDVDKIVSPYGCGPTDENGLPLFGLRALKKRTPTSTDLPIVPSQASSSEKASEIEPTDLSGRPLFGLKALKKSQEEISESQELKSTSTTVSSSSRSSYNTSYVRRDELNERRQESEDEREEEEEESSDDSHSSSESSDEEDSSSSKVQGLKDSYKKKTDSQTSLNTEVIKPSARLRDTYITSESTTESSHTQDEEIISSRSKPLRDILQHHESIVTEPESIDEAPREKPKAKLRDFEATDLHDTKHTWDLESDLSTRSQDVKNIINKHEVISVSESSAATSEKKLTSILKKSSTSSMSGSLESSAYAEKSTNESTIRQLNSTNDILDTLTEDQINSLSAEFDLRAQEDGVIKNKDSLEKLNQDIDTTGTTGSTTSETTTSGEKEFVRKTSYTEIKFSQPSSHENGTTKDVVSHSEPNVNDSDNYKDISDSHNVVITAEVTNTETTEIIELTSESSSHSKMESILQTKQNKEIINQEDSSEILVDTESVESTERQTVDVTSESETMHEMTSISETESLSKQTEKEDTEISLTHEKNQQHSLSKKTENTVSKVSSEKSINKNISKIEHGNDGSNVKECKNTDRDRVVKNEKNKQASNKKDQTRNKSNDMKGKKIISTNIDQTKNLSKEKTKQIDTKKKVEGNTTREKKGVQKKDTKQTSADSKLKKQEKKIETKTDIKTKKKGLDDKVERNLNIKKEQVCVSSDNTKSAINNYAMKKVEKNLDVTTTMENSEAVNELKLDNSRKEDSQKTSVNVELSEDLNTNSEVNKTIISESVVAQVLHDDLEISRHEVAVNEDSTINLSEIVETHSDLNTHEIVKDSTIKVCQTVETHSDVNTHDIIEDSTLNASETVKTQLDLNTHEINEDSTINISETVETHSDLNTSKIIESQIETKETKLHHNKEESIAVKETDSDCKIISSESSARESSPSRIPKIGTNIELENRVKKISAACDLVLEKGMSKSILLTGTSLKISDKDDKKIRNTSKENAGGKIVTKDEESEKIANIVKDQVEKLVTENVLGKSVKTVEKSTSEMEASLITMEEQLAKISNIIKKEKDFVDVKIRKISCTDTESQIEEENLLASSASESTLKVSAETKLVDTTSLSQVTSTESDVTKKIELHAKVEESDVITDKLLNTTNVKQDTKTNVDVSTRDIRNNVRGLDIKENIISDDYSNGSADIIDKHVTEKKSEMIKTGECTDDVKSTTDIKSKKIMMEEESIKKTDATKERKNLIDVNIKSLNDTDSISQIKDANIAQSSNSESTVKVSNDTTVFDDAISRETLIESNETKRTLLDEKYVKTDFIKEEVDDTNVVTENLSGTDSISHIEDTSLLITNDSLSTSEVSAETTVVDTSSAYKETLLESNIIKGTQTNEKVITSDASVAESLNIKQVKERYGKNEENSTKDKINQVKSSVIKEKIKPNESKVKILEDSNKSVIDSTSDKILTTEDKSREEKTSSELEEKKLLVKEKSSVKLIDNSCDLHTTENDTIIKEQKLSKPSEKKSEIEESMKKTTELLRSVSIKLEKRISEVCDESIKTMKNESNIIHKVSDVTADMKRNKKEDDELYSKSNNELENESRKTNVEEQSTKMGTIDMRNIDNTEQESTKIIKKIDENKSVLSEKRQNTQAERLISSKSKAVSKEAERSSLKSSKRTEHKQKEKESINKKSRIDPVDQDPHGKLSSAKDKTEVEVIKSKKEKLKSKSWIGPLDFVPESREPKKDVKYIKRSSVSKPKDPSIDSKKESKDQESFTTKEDYKNIEKACNITKNIAEATEDKQKEIIIKESTEVKLVTEDGDTIGDELEINTEIPSRLNDDKKQVTTSLSIEKDNSVTSSELIKEKTVKSVKIAKERNLSIKDITGKEKSSEKLDPNTVKDKSDIKRKNKTENDKDISTSTKIEEKRSKLNSTKDKTDKVIAEKITMKKKSKLDSIDDKITFVEEKVPNDIGDKVSVEKNIEEKEASKKPEYNRQMSLGTEIKKMAANNVEKENVKYNKTKTVKEKFEENVSVSTKDKFIEVSKSETIEPRNEILTSKGEAKSKEIEDTVTDSLKECDEIIKQNISSKSKNTVLTTDNEMKERQCVISKNKQTTITPANEKPQEERGASKRETKEKNVSLKNIIGTKNTDTKEQRGIKVKDSDSSKKVTNKRNIALKDIVGTKRKSRKSLHKGDSGQGPKYENTQIDKLNNEEVTAEISTISTDERLSCNTTLKSDTTSVGKDLSKKDSLSSTSKSEKNKLQEIKARKTSSDTQGNKEERNPWVGPLDVNPSSRRHSSGKKISSDEGSLKSSNKRNTYSRTNSLVDERQDDLKRSVSSESQNRRKRKETIDNTIQNERSPWIGPLDHDRSSSKSSVDRKYSSDNYSRTPKSERKWSAEKRKQERKQSDSAKREMKRSDSAQSLSNLSTTSSTPSYMRPRDRRRSSRTPERDQKDIDEVLRNSQIYTRCTKRSSTPPTRNDYDYTHAVIPDAAGGGGSYSIYFGPRDRLPDEYSNASHSRSCSRPSSRSHSMSPERELMYKSSVEEKLVTDSVVNEESRISIETGQARKDMRSEHSAESKSIENSEYIPSSMRLTSHEAYTTSECKTKLEKDDQSSFTKKSNTDNTEISSDSQMHNQTISSFKHVPESKASSSSKLDTEVDQRHSLIHDKEKQDIEFVEASSLGHQESRNSDTTLIRDSSTEKSSKEASYQQRSSSRVVESSSSAIVDSSSAEMRVEASSGGRSFLDDRSKVSGVTDILSRMSATEAVDHDKKITSDDQARSLLNRFLGAQVLMTGVESMMANAKEGGEQTSSSNVTSSSKSMSVRSEIDAAGRSVITHEASGQASKMASKDGKITENTTKSFSTGPVTTTTTRKALGEPVLVSGVNISEVTDDVQLNQLLDSCDEYEDRRKVRMRLKALMAEKKALRSELSGHDLGSKGQGTGAPESRTREAQALSTTSNTKQSNLRSTEVNVQKSSYSTSSSSSNTQSSSFRSSSKQSAFDKFKSLDSNNPRKPNKSISGGGGDAFDKQATTIKDVMLQWCQCRCRDYKGVKIENFSTSWNDGMAFCALIHHFYPEAFEFDKLDPKNRRYNFDLAFRTADEKAGVMALLDVDDMVAMKKPDWKCVFTYVQALYKKLG